MTPSALDITNYVKRVNKLTRVSDRKAFPDKGCVIGNRGVAMTLLGHGGIVLEDIPQLGDSRWFLGWDDIDPALDRGVFVTEEGAVVDSAGTTLGRQLDGVDAVDVMLKLLGWVTTCVTVNRLELGRMVRSVPGDDVDIFFTEDGDVVVSSFHPDAVLAVSKAKLKAVVQSFRDKSITVCLGETERYKYLVVRTESVAWVIPPKIREVRGE